MKDDDDEACQSEQVVKNLGTSEHLDSSYFLFLFHSCWTCVVVLEVRRVVEVVRSSAFAA